MAVDQQALLAALQVVTDPNTGKDFVSTKAVKNLHIHDGDVSFDVELGYPAKSQMPALRKALIAAAKGVAGVDNVSVNLSMKITAHAVQRGVQLLPQVKNIIAVASGKGGVGKSTISVNIAVALAKTGARVGLVDTDIYGPSIPTMFATNERPNINTQRKLIPIEKYGVKLLSMGFLVDPDQAVVWRGPMVSSAVKQFLTDSQWGELDYLVMDLPPGTGDIQLTIVQTVPLTGAVIVSTPQDVALDDARKGVAMFKKVNVPVLGIVENMAYFTPPDAPDKKYHIFGKDGARNLATRLDVPFLGEVPLEQMVREGGDEGLPAVLKDATSPAARALTEIAIKVAQQVSIRNMTQDATQKVEILFKP
jgi:ATP-binding protein involved in chromosome partitioning